MPIPSLFAFSVYVYRHLFEMHFNDTFSSPLHTPDMDMANLNPTHKNNLDDDDEEEEEDENATNGAFGASSSKHAPVRHYIHSIDYIDPL